MTTVLALHGSPRRRGNSWSLLQQAVLGAKQRAAQVVCQRAADLAVAPCIACDHCRREGRCVQHDDLAQLYPMLETVDVILIATPVYFMGPPAQLKAIIDRCQVQWWSRQAKKSSQKSERSGYLLSVAGGNLAHSFDGLVMTIKSLFWSLDVRYAGELLVPDVDQVGAINDHPEVLQKAFELGFQAVSKKQRA